jgi:HlyD family secretion protein
MKQRVFFLIMLVTLIFLSACSGMPAPAPVAAAAETAVEPQTVTAEGKLLPAQKAELSFVQAGVIGEVLVQPGDRVKSGAVLAHLVGIETVQAELAAAELEQILAQQSLDTLRRGAMLTGADAHKALQTAQKAYETEARGWRLGSEDDATDLELAMDQYIKAEANYRKAKAELDSHADKDLKNPKRQNAQRTFDDEKADLTSRYAELMEEIPTADERLDEKQTTLLKSISTLELARQQVARLDKGIDREQFASSEARLKAAGAHLAAAKAALAFYELRAPFAGTVLRVDHLSTGKAAIPGQAVLFLADTSRWIVETKDLAEIDIARVALGQSASVALDAFTDETFKGTVSAIDPVGREYLGDMTYQIIITLDAADPRFYWNMTATVTVAGE